MAAKRPDPMAVIMSIVERGSGNKLNKLYRENQVFVNLRCEGAGTATSEIMDILGLGSSEKDILISTAAASAASALLDRLDDELRGAVPGRGIAFSLPLTAVNNLVAAFVGLMTRSERDREDDSMEKQQKNSLILVTVNQGFTETVMDTAQSRGITTLQAEKEIIFIVVPKDIRNQVMDAVNKAHGIHSEAGAMVCAMGIEQLAHLG